MLQKLLKKCLILTGIAATGLALTLTAQAQNPTFNPATPTIIPSPPTLNAQAYLLMDVNSGKIIAAKNIEQRRAPASLTKLMTLYLTFQALKSGTIQLDSKVRISKDAWQMGGSKMFVRVGTDVPVSQLIQGVIVDSGNDACVALAEFVAGSQSSFVNMMNQEAQLLGMKNTHYIDPTGLPKPEHFSTAHDMAILARAIIQNFPQYYHYFSEKWLTYSGIRQPNRNRLLWRFEDTDGLKTGHTKEAGFCLIASAKRNGTRLLSVVMGTPTDEARADDSIRLLTYGFRFYLSHLVYQGGSPIATPRIWFAKNKTIPAGVANDLYVTVPRGQAQKLQAIIQTNPDLKAPIKKGQTIGTVQVKFNNQIVGSAPLVTLATDQEGGWWRRMVDHIEHLWHSWFGGDKNIMTKTITITPPAIVKPAPKVKS